MFNRFLDWLKAKRVARKIQLIDQGIVSSLDKGTLSRCATIFLVHDRCGRRLRVGIRLNDGKPVWYCYHCACEANQDEYNRDWHWSPFLTEGVRRRISEIAREF